MIDIAAVIRGRSLVAVVAVLALAGCGGKKADTTVATTAVDQQPPPTSTTAVPAPSTGKARATQQRLVKATLTAGDVGAGWKLTPIRGALVVSQWCNRALADGLDPYAQSDAAFTQKYGSTITQQLSAYSGEGAERVLRDFRDVVANCGSWRSTPEPGRTVTYTVTPVDAKLPRDTVAVHVRSSNVFGNIEVRRSTVAVLARRGQVVDLLMQTANAGLSQPAAPVLKLAQRADRRLAGGR